MSMDNWAKHEVELACKREAPDLKDDEWDYGCSCYQSALKAYMSLMDDEHSGMSFSFTANILKRMLEGKPLTPIEDTPEAWNDICYESDGKKTYQCKRMSSLFKDVDSEGKATYHDISRYYCRDVDTGSTYRCGLEEGILNEIEPITMPYYPPLGYYIFETATFLTDRKNGDFDTKAISTLTYPNGKCVNIDKFFAETGHGWDEIDYLTFIDRNQMHLDRIKKEQEEKDNG